jgi:hypothetical protein
MRMTMTRRCVLGLAGLLACASMVPAYPVGFSVGLDELAGDADVIFKGTAGFTGPVQDEWFKPVRGFIACETQFKVVSVLKGEGLGEGAAFRHYDSDPKPIGISFMPQSYHFEKGRTYIVLAQQEAAAGVLRQLWANHKSKTDQGVLLCADAEPLRAKTVKGVFEGELMKMLSSPRVSDVLYAVNQLDQMSGGETSDFNREEALAAVIEVITNPDPQIAQGAIGMIGHNPYIGGNPRLYPNMKNIGGEKYWKRLVAVADGGAVNETRARAIQALGLVREPALLKPIERWLADPAPAVRASAALLLADFPGPETRQRLTTLAGDTAPEVRACMARAAGFSQQVELAEVLSGLLKDPERKVREAAAMSLLSFSPENETIAKVFKANLENKEFQPLFLIALARENPGDYLDALATAVEQKTEPKNFWGGQIPAFTAWTILFRYLQGQPFDAVRSGKLNRYLDAMEKVGNYSSSEPRDIYAFYLQRGMTDRAQKFRQEARKAVTYDLDYYFKMVDENPSLYKRE